MKKITAWSPSRYAEYNQCPRKTKYKVIDKMKEPQGAALARGEAIHAEAENYICGRTSKLHADLVKVKPLINKLRKGYTDNTVRVELEMAFTEKWRLTEWFAKDAWLRLKVDVVQIGKGKTTVTDWKTGKLQEGDKYDDQLNLYALGALAAGFGAKVESQLAFTDHGKIITRPAGKLALPDLKAAMETWEQRVRPMMRDTLFVPQPGMHCRWCAFSKNKGGPCEY